MKVLFVCSGNSRFGISSIVKAQGESLKKNGVEIEYFLIKGKGIVGYLKNILPLRKYLKNNNFDITHAHYSLSAYVASLARTKPIVVSLMGSDVQKNFFGCMILKLFYRIFWNSLIVKSNSMKKRVGIKKCFIIPNGVDFEKFKEIDKKIAKEKIGFDPNKKHIVFVANPDRYEKNFILAIEAFDLLDDKSVELNVVSGVAYEDIPYYYYAADVLLLTSLWEGSPNVIKEAMACNCPIVSTDVGDVREVIENTEGCYITSFEPDDVAEKLKLALRFGKRTNGRENIKYLDSNIIAKKIIKIYEHVFEKRKF